MLTSEIATMISGRYIQIEMLPLSFKEYMESTGNMNDRGIKDEMFFRIFQVYFYLIPPQVNGNKQINER